MRSQQYLESRSRLVRETIDKILPPSQDVLTKACRHLIEAGGKMFRPCLCLACFEALGGTIDEEILKIASVLELVHIFTLVHDDIIDRSERRRGVMTVHTLWGEEVAIIAGDTLLSKAFEVLSGSTKSTSEIVKLVASACVEVCEGQVMDMLLLREDADEETYLRTVEKKTGALFSASSGIGTLLAGRPEFLSQMAEYGRLLGIAFQMRDDVLGFLGQDIGKPPDSDIREGKRTLVTIEAMKNPELKRELFGYLGKRDLSAEEFSRIRELLIKFGVIDIVMKKAVKYAELAREKLNVLPESEMKEVLDDFTRMVVERTC